MGIASTLRFAGAPQPPSPKPSGRVFTEKREAPPPGRLSHMLPYPSYLLMDLTSLLGIQSGMESDVFQRQVHEIGPDKVNVMAHELGHLLPGAAAGRHCTGLSLRATKRDGRESAGFVGFREQPGDLRETLEDLVKLAGGLGGALQILSSEDLENPQKLQNALLNAGQDAEDMAALLQDAGEKGWLDAEAVQLPLVDLQNLKRVKEQLLSEKNTAPNGMAAFEKRAEPLRHYYSQQLARFFQFPLFREALETARSIQEVVPRERQLAMFRYLAPKRELNEPQVQRFLNRFVPQDERAEMADNLESFVQKYSRNNGKALNEKGRDKSSPWANLLKKPVSLYGTF